VNAPPCGGLTARKCRSSKLTIRVVSYLRASTTTAAVGEAEFEVRVLGVQFAELGVVGALQARHLEPAGGEVSQERGSRWASKALPQHVIDLGRHRRWNYERARLRSQGFEDRLSPGVVGLRQRYQRRGVEDRRH
jgi:hypothetical protein